MNIDIENHCVINRSLCSSSVYSQPKVTCCGLWVNPLGVEWKMNTRPAGGEGGVVVIEKNYILYPITGGETLRCFEIGRIKEAAFGIYD